MQIGSFCSCGHNHAGDFGAHKVNGSSGVSFITIKISGISVGTVVNNGIGILRYGEALRGPLSRISRVTFRMLKI